MKKKEHHRRVREKVVENFRAGLGFKTKPQTLNISQCSLQSSPAGLKGPARRSIKSDPYRENPSTWQLLKVWPLSESKKTKTSRSFPQFTLRTRQRGRSCSGQMRPNIMWPTGKPTVWQCTSAWTHSPPWWNMMVAASCCGLLFCNADREAAQSWWRNYVELQIQDAKKIILSFFLKMHQFLPLRVQY